MSAPKLRTAVLSQAGAEPARLDRSAARHQHPGARHWALHTRHTRTPRARNRHQHLGCNQPGDPQRLLPQRALSALEGFRRIIQDAHALLEPGFAEKLTTDLDASAEVLSEGGYTQGPNAEDEAEDQGTEDEGTEDQAAFDEDTGFAFGAQGVLDLTHDEPADDSFSPESFAEAAPDEEADVTFNPFDDVAPKRGGRQTKETPPTRRSKKSVHHSVRPAARRLTGVIRFINDRSGYIRALEDEGTPEASPASKI